jgi:hypothetical protein
MFRPCTLMLFALLVSAAMTTLADTQPKVHDGIVVSTAAETLVMTDRDGKNQNAHKIDDATAVTIDGKPAKLTDLVKGDKVKVSAGQDGKIVSIAAVRSKQKRSA